MSGARALDLAVILAYLVFMAWLGLRFSRKQKTTEDFFVAKRSVPSWAMGLSLLATLISSVTFIAYPGSAYSKDWSNLVPGFLVLGVLLLVGSIIIPFYRHVVGMSAYEYFEKRFGRPARVYASIAFTLAHFSKMGFVFYLMALTVNSITGWSLDIVVCGVCAVMILYTVKGGIEAVIWTDVVQAFITWVGVIVALCFLLFLPPGGPSAVFQLASEQGKFSLGRMQLDYSTPTIPVLLVYGFFWYLQRYTADQTVVQRYLVAKSDRGALKGVALGAVLCVPIWALFMLIGTCTWAFYKLTSEQLPAYITKADQIFPHFIATHLPAGFAGLFMASLMGASMTMLASDLNCLAAVGVEDFYRALRPQATDRQRLRMARILIVVVGILSAATALILAHAKGNALSMWFAVSAIVSGGLAGLFLLAFLSRRANPRGVYLGIAASLLCTVWAVLTNRKIVDLGPLNYHGDDLTIGALGHMTLFFVGYLGSLLFRRGTVQQQDMTVWAWIRDRKTREAPLVQDRNA